MKVRRTVSIYSGTNVTVWAPPGPIRIVAYSVLVTAGVTTAAPDALAAILTTVADVNVIADGASENILAIVPLISSNTYSEFAACMQGVCDRIVKSPQVVSLRVKTPSAGSMAASATLVYEVLT